MRATKILVIGIVGFILGYSLWRFDHDGYSQKWKKLAAPPYDIVELIPTGEPPLFIKASDGNTYYLSYQYNEGWLQKSIPEELINPFEVTKPCDLSFPEFSHFSNAPENIRDCVQQKTMYADGYIKSAFVVDNEGNIWEWSHTISPEDLTPMFCLPASGLLIGLLVGFVRTSGVNGEKEKS